MPGYAAYKPGSFEIISMSDKNVIDEPHKVEIEEAKVNVDVPELAVAGTRIQVSSQLNNTACKNLLVKDVKTNLFTEEPGAEYDLGFAPSLEIIEGEELVQRGDGDYTHTLESAEELTFTGSGTVKLKITYNMINPFENGDGREFKPYNPEKIVEINVVDPIPVESICLSAEAVVTATAGGKIGECKVTVKIKEVSKGDINFDGAVDASDLMYMLQVVSERINKEDLTGGQLRAGDVTGDDNQITADDLMKMLQFVSERITSLE